MAWVMMKTMRTSGSESLAGASNIFLGQNEAALVIRPYLDKMTQSEIVALMTTGFSTIATGVMAVYAGMEGISAGHILTASVLGSVEEHHVAMASGFNSAVARTGGLIATALLGSVLASAGAALFAGFHMAMFVSAGVAALAGIVALTMLGGVSMKKA